MTKKLFREYHIPFLYLFNFAISFFFIFLTSTSLAQDQLLQPTPHDAEGPFYPIIRQADEDNDLLQVTGQKQKAKGEILYLSGRVISENGQPYSNAIVEIWQTDSEGLYQDNRDRSPGKRDPYFQYWGKAKSGADGSYSFTTLVPGKYYPRPAHIHFKVWINDKVRLTSQIYFREQDGQDSKRNSRYATPALQTVELEKIDKGKYKAWFQIVL